METIFDTDFSDGEEAVPYRGAKSARSGRVGDMTGGPERGFDVPTRFLPDRGAEGFKAPFAA